MSRTISDAITKAKTRINALKNQSYSYPIPPKELDLTGLDLTREGLEQLIPEIKRIGNLSKLNISNIPLIEADLKNFSLGDLFGTLKVKVSYDNNDTYSGDMRFGRFHGFGTLKFANGFIYNGEFKNNQAHGKGTFTDNKGNSHQGTFKNGSIEGWGITKYSSGEVLEGMFYKGKMVFDDPENELKPNTIPTLVARSQQMKNERRKTKYEVDKHKKEGFTSEVVIVTNGKELLKTTEGLLEKHPDTKAFRLVINQHSGQRVNPDIKMSKKEVKAILQLLVNRGIEDIRISSHSCNITEAQLFMDLAHDFTDKAQITIYTTPDGKNAFEGLKKNKKSKGEKFTSFYLTDDGEYAPRDKHVFEKQPVKGTKKVTSDQKLTNAKVFTKPLNQDKDSTDKAKKYRKLKPRIIKVHPKP